MSTPFTVKIKGITYNLLTKSVPNGNCDGCVFNDDDELSCVTSHTIDAQSGYNCMVSSQELIFLAADQATKNQLALDRIAKRLKT